MKILAEHFQRLLYNAIQFSAKDSSLGGVVWFITQPHDGDGGNALLDVYASDDYVAMRDQCPMTTEREESFYLGLKEVKELEKALRVVEGQVQTQFPVGSTDLEVMWATEDGKDVLSILLQTVTEPPDFSAVVEVVHSEPNPFTGEFSPASEPFAIRAERFTKFRLLRTPESPSCRDGYPIDFLWDGRLVRWRCGPNLKGVIGPLARYTYVDQATGEQVTGIKQLYATEEVEVLW